MMIIFKLFYSYRKTIKEVLESSSTPWFIAFVTAFAFAEKIAHFYLLGKNLRWTMRVSGITIPAQLQLMEPLITVPLNVILTALFLHGIILVIKKESRFKQSLLLVSFTSLVFCISYTIKIISYSVLKFANFNTHLGLLFSSLISNGIIYNFLSKIDIFSIWQITLLAISLDELAIIKTRKGFFILIVAYIIFALFKVLITE